MKMYLAIQQHRRNDSEKGCYSVVFDMLPEVELVHLAPFTGMQMFYGEPEPRLISFMQVKEIERMHNYIISNGWIRSQR